MPKKKMGRPLKPINWEQVETLCKIQCTEEEICAVIGVSDETLNKRCKKEHGVTFLEFLRQKKSGGKASLRRNQWKLGESNVAMAIWLGKQHLGQKDQHDVTQTNKNIEIKINEDDKEL